MFLLFLIWTDVLLYRFDGEVYLVEFIRWELFCFCVTRSKSKIVWCLFQDANIFFCMAFELNFVVLFISRWFASVALQAMYLRVCVWWNSLISVVCNEQTSISTSANYTASNVFAKRCITVSLFEIRWEKKTTTKKNPLINQWETNKMDTDTDKNCAGQKQMKKIFSQFDWLIRFALYFLVGCVFISGQL